MFRCYATGAVDCRLVEDYSADSFVLAFIRFSCRYGYPKQLLTLPLEISSDHSGSLRQTLRYEKVGPILDL